MKQTVNRNEIDRLPKSKVIDGERCFKALSANGRFVVYRKKGKRYRTVKGWESGDWQTIERYEITDAEVI